MRLLSCDVFRSSWNLLAPLASSVLLSNKWLRLPKLYPAIRKSLFWMNLRRYSTKKMRKRFSGGSKALVKKGVGGFTSHIVLKRYFEGVTGRTIFSLENVPGHTRPARLTRGVA